MPIDIQKHLNTQVARLVMELATAHAVIEELEAQIALLKRPSGEGQHSDKPDGARSADEPVQE